MSEMGQVLAAPEQAMVVCNGYMIIIYNMKPLDASFMLKPNKIQNPKVQFGTFWTQIVQTSHCAVLSGHLEGQLSSMANWFRSSMFGLQN